MTKFQLFLTSLFGFFIIVAVLVFALYRGSGSSADAKVTIWGDLPSEAIYPNLQYVSTIDKGLTITYIEKDPETINDEFTEALASGVGPDVIIITQESFLKNKSKLIAIPYESISQRDFSNTFAEGGELFMSEEGVYALPIAIDPLVLYYNRDLLSAAGETGPIRYWDEIYSQTGKLSRRDAAGNLVQSTIALGEVRNIPNFKEIISLLMLQAGTPITGYLGDTLRAQLNERFGLPTAPSEAALDFYTQFSNPSRSYYSWNRILPEAQTHFTTGDSAYYLGFASEQSLIRNKNPNLNWSVVTVPQSRVAGRVLTYGKTYGLAITRGTRSTENAFRAIRALISTEIAGQIANSLRLAPARRDLLSQRQTDNVYSVFYEAALQARGWRDPEDEATRTAFGEMVESITSGRARTQEAITNANGKIDALIK